MAASMMQCEFTLLSSFPVPETTDCPTIVKQFLQGDYEDILESSECAKKLLSHQNAENASISDLCKFIKTNVETLMLDGAENTDCRDLSVLTVAASCLQLFVQNNWLGPPTTKSPIEFLQNKFHSKLKELNVEAQNELSADGESVYSQSRHLLYLYIARIILLECHSFFTESKTWDWWLMRCLLTQQTLLSDRSPTLKATVMELMDKCNMLCYSTQLL
ncbi:tetratricopeptide repeat protein 27-like [Aplysia californica]|uniref:Tetratricopeptide repeat protein 27-like n=1 Tax=Aplysia californica TaxID=6500 RepID=A0ABM1A7Q0_APLCA|nr:tetratricopeptide repeat protein 27-like [Aplysia californica]